MKKGLHLLAIILLLLSSRQLFGQNNLKIDSLLKELSTAKDSARVHILHHLCWKYIGTDLKKADEYAQQLFEESSRIGYKKGIAFGHNDLGEVNFRRGDYETALKHHQQALVLYTELGADRHISDCYNNIAGVYYMQGDYPQVLEYLIKAAKINEEKLNNYDVAATIYSNIGLVYYAQASLTKNKADYAKSEEYHKRSLSISLEHGDSASIASSYNNLGVLRTEHKDYPGALSYYEKALKIRERLGNPIAISECYSNIGTISYMQAEISGDKKEFEKALGYFNKALAIALKVNNKEQSGSIYTSIGNTHEKLGNSQQAIQALEKALEISGETGALAMMRDCLGSLASVHKSRGDYEKALAYYEQAAEIKDSLLNEEKSRQIGELDKKYESEKKEKEIALLNEKQTKTDAEIKQQNIVRNFLFGVVGLIFMLGLVLFNAYRNKQKANVLLNAQKQQIEKQKQEITDSITYARNIQQALLPPSEEIAMALKQSFVLYQPKDIVSGDFYWFHPIAGKDEQYLIAAADCTGHGVPGAFMSMIGVEKLNEIANSVSNPGDILTALNKAVKKALHQSGATEGKTRDGMDIALCAIDPAKRLIRFAGANRPLYVVKGEGPNSAGKEGSFIEIKPTKTAIGGFTSESQLFETHEIVLQPGDCIYLFSDGYADQFGGGSGKKMMTKKFRELLLSIAHLPLHEQQSRLESFFSDWKSGYEQVDDVLVIGIRV